MNKRMVFTKTAKGLMEATGKTSLLSRELRSVLAKVDGRMSVGQMVDDAALADEDVMAAMSKLLDQGFVRELIAGPATTMAPASQLALPDAAGGGDLDFSTIAKTPPGKGAGRPPAPVPAPAPNFPSVTAVPGGIPPVAPNIQQSAKAELRAEADAMAQELAAVLAKAQAEAEGKSQPAPEAKAPPAPDAARAPRREPAPAPSDDQNLRKQIEEEIRRSEEAEAKIARERARRDAEARVRKEIEDKARAEAEAKARQEAEKKARAEAEAKAARENEDRVRKEVEDKIRREADDRKRREEQARLRADMDARRQTAEVRRAPAESAAAAIPAGARKRMPARSGRLSFWFLVIVVVGGLGVLQFLPLDADRYAQLASDRFQLPITIQSARFSLLPTPTVTFENVTVARVPIANIKAVPEITTLLDERPAFKSVEFSGMTMSPESLAGMLWRKPGARGVTIWEIRVHDFKLALPGAALPTLDLTAVLLRDGQLKEVRLASADRKLSASLVPDRGNRVAMEINADSLAPFGLPFALSDFSGKATATPRELVINDFDARVLGGVLKGKGTLRWSDGWSIDGEVELRTGEANQIAPEAFVSGRVGGRGAFSFRSQDPAKLFAGARMDGTFNVENAVLGNIDLPRMVQTGLFATGTTQLSEFSGHGTIESNRVSLRQVRIVAGPMNAAGNIDVEPGRNLSGKLATQMTIGTATASGTFALGGTIARPQLTR